MKKKTKTSLILTLVYLLSLCINASAYAEKKTTVSKKTYERIEQYISENIFSYIYNNNLSKVTSLNFFISKDGQFSIITYCNRSGIDEHSCLTNSPYIFQSKYRCEKISKQECYIILDRKKIISKDSNYEISLNNLNIFFHIDSKLSNNPKNHSEFEVASSKDFEGGGNYE